MTNASPSPGKQRGFGEVMEKGYESLVELGRAESGENLRYGYLGRCDGGECDDYEVDYDDDGVHGSKQMSRGLKSETDVLTSHTEEIRLL
ncbi:hypothetical protein Tco_1142047 [Tanacetum coccineum]